MQGLKTGMYYLRTKPAVNAVQFTVDKRALRQSNSASTPLRDLGNKENQTPLMNAAAKRIEVGLQNACRHVSPS